MNRRFRGAGNIIEVMRIVSSNQETFTYAVGMQRPAGRRPQTREGVVVSGAKAEHARAATSIATRQPCARLAPYFYCVALADVFLAAHAGEEMTASATTMALGAHCLCQQVGHDVTQTMHPAAR